MYNCLSTYVYIVNRHQNPQNNGRILLGQGEIFEFFCQKIYYWWSDPLTPLTIMETKGKLKEKMNRNLPERK